MPEQTQSNIDQTQLVHQPAPTVANPPPRSTNIPTPKPPKNGNRDSSDSEDEEQPEVARDVAIGGMGAIVGGVVVGATMMKLGTASGGNSDVAAKELQALKQKMKEMSVLKLSGEVNKDTLEAAISEAIGDAKKTVNNAAAGSGNNVQQSKVEAAKKRLDEVNALETELMNTVVQMVKNKAEYSDMDKERRDANISSAKTEHKACLTALENEHTELEEMRVAKKKIRDELDYCMLHLKSEKKQKETLKEVLKTLTVA